MNDPGDNMFNEITHIQREIFYDHTCVAYTCNRKHGISAWVSNGWMKNVVCIYDGVLSAWKRRLFSHCNNMVEFVGYCAKQNEPDREADSVWWFPLVFRIFESWT